MRRLLAATVIFVATLCSLSARAAEQPSLARVKAMLEAGQEPVRIVCFGDSVTGVYYHTGGRRAWPDMLGIALARAYPKARIEVFNAGISGHTTSAALARIDRDVIARKPHLAVVMFGLNDIARGNRDSYRANLKTIIDHCRGAGAAVVLCTLNSVYPNATRPMAAVAEFSGIVRDVARKNSVPVADCFHAYEALRAKDNVEWMVMMSEDIHPGMDGHKLFAETVAQTIAGKPVPLRDVPPPADTLQFTRKRLAAGQPVRVIAMPPYDRMIGELLTEFYPAAKVEVTPWPVEGQSLAAIVKRAEGIRAQTPTLVVMAVPAGAKTENDEAFIPEYHWVRSWCVAFGDAQWDLLAVLPNVTAPLTAAEAPRAELARRIIACGDVEYVERKAGDARPAREILQTWMRDRIRPAPATTTLPTPSYHWRQVAAKAAFAPRDGAGAVVFQNKMWLLGGWNPHDKKYFPIKCNSEVWRSTDGAAWTLQLAKAPWEGRHTAGYVVFQGKMWIVGGDCLQGHYQGDVWNSADGVHWQKVTERTPWGERCLHYTVVHDNKIWVLGGQTVPQFAPAPVRFYNDVWNSSDGEHWTQVTAKAPWAPRGMIGGAAVFQGRIWILGGGTYDIPADSLPRKFYNDVWSSVDGVTWQRHTQAAPWHPRQYHDVAVFDNRLWVLEGWNVGNRNDVWHSADGVHWQELPNTPWPPRHAASVFVYDGALWMVAGNNMQSDVWRLDRGEAAPRAK